MAVTQAQVAQLYVALFNRAPEGDGFNAWVRAGANKTQAQIAQEMLNSDAARSYYNGRINQDKDFVEMLYKNILGKDYSQDPSGIDAWVRHIQAGNSRGDTIVKLFEVATSAAARAADPVAAATFANKTEISAYMAQKISQIAQDNSGNYDYTPFQEIIRTTNATNLTEQKARVDQLANTAYHTLTTGEDTVNGTTKADVINGVISSVVSQNTFNPEDKIDGGSGEDTLNAVMTTNFNGFSGGYLRNVENLNLTNNSGTRKVFNAEGVEGLRKVNIGGDSATRVINLANIVDLSAADVKSGDILLTYNPAIIAGSNDEQNLTLDNVGAATAEGMMSNSIVTTFSGIEKLNITTKGSASYISGVSNKNIVVKGDAALDIALAGTKAAPNGVTTNFDASALNANLSADLVGGYTTLEDVKGGKGNDTFKANINSASVGIFKVNGGDGNDTLEFNDLDGGLNTARKLESTSIENLIFKNSEITTSVPAVLDLEKSPDVTSLTVGLKDTMSNKSLNVINSANLKTLNVLTSTGAGNKITIDTANLNAVNYTNEIDTDSKLVSVTAANATKLDVSLKGIISGTGTIKADKATTLTLTMDSKDVGGKNLSFEAPLATTMKVTTTQADSVFDSTANKLKALKTLDVTTAGKFKLSNTATEDHFATLSTINLKGTNEKSSATVVAGIQSSDNAHRSTSIQDINLTADHLQDTRDNHQSLKATLNTQGTINVSLNNDTRGEVEIDTSNAGTLNIENNSANIQHLKLSSTLDYTDATDSVIVKGGTAHKVTIGKIAANKIDIDLGQTLGVTSFKDGINDSWMVANDIKLKISHITGTNETIDLRMAGGRDFKADITGSVKNDTINITKTNSIVGVENIKVSGDLGAGYDKYTLNTSNTGDSLRTIDLSGLRNVEKGTITLDALNAKNLISLKATDGEDTVTLHNNMLSETTIRNLDIDLGAGDDKITFGTLTASKTITVKGGAGGDEFVVTNAKTDADASKYVVISDASSGDKIKFGAVSDIMKIPDSVVRDKTTLKEAIKAALGYTSPGPNSKSADAVNMVSYFTYGNDTYVFHNDSTGPHSPTTDDHLVKLAGVRADDIIATYDTTQGTFNIN
ncbi:MAG: DUF4214 domain-containing protein [Campylobacter sp.]|uniref:DUF4214 domain-containing protein n=1 Tax=Campylobacter sp. TaxID=205 RepID=UPI0036061CFF